MRQVCDEIRITNMDTHLLFAQVGERLGLIPESTVAAAFANIWAQAYTYMLEQILEPIRDKLPVETKPA